MKEFKGKKVEPRQIDGVELKDCPDNFQKGKYIGFCNLDNQPHGIGELISNDNDENPWSLNGEWENGIFISGSYNQPYFSRYEGSFIFDDRIGSGDLELHGQGIELHYRSKENYLNNKIIGHVKGLFEAGNLVVGEILNPSLIDYSEHKGIKKIIYKKADVKRLFDKNFGGEINLTYGEIFYDDGAHYEGELNFDLPYGKGTMTLADGRKKVCEWIHGNIKENE